MAEQKAQTLAAFVVENGVAARTAPGGDREGRRGRQQREDRRRRDRGAHEARAGSRSTRPRTWAPSRAASTVPRSAWSSARSSPARRKPWRRRGRRSAPQPAQPFPRCRHRRQVHEAISRRSTRARPFSSSSTRASGPPRSALIENAIKAENALLIQSTLPPEKAAALQALVEPAAEVLGGDEVVADFEVQVEEAPEEPAAAPRKRPRRRARPQPPLAAQRRQWPRRGRRPYAAGRASARRRPRPRRGRNHHLRRAGRGQRAADPPRAPRGRHDAARQRGDVADAGLVRHQGRLAGPDEAQREGDGGPANRQRPRTAAAAAHRPTTLPRSTASARGSRRSSTRAGSDLRRARHANSGDLRQMIAVGGALPPSSLDSWPTQASTRRTATGPASRATTEAPPLILGRSARGPNGPAPAPPTSPTVRPAPASSYPTSRDRPIRFPTGRRFSTNACDALCRRT